MRITFPQSGGFAGLVRHANTVFYAVWHFGPRWRFEERRGIVAGRPAVERVAIAELVPEPPPGLPRQVADWFATHDVDPDTIPTLPVPPP
jgi:hypothetical protein